jgi:hypothetical protein
MRQFRWFHFRWVSEDYEVTNVRYDVLGLMDDRLGWTTGLDGGTLYTSWHCVSHVAAWFGPVLKICSCRTLLLAYRNTVVEAPDGSR